MTCATCEGSGDDQVPFADPAPCPDCTGNWQCPRCDCTLPNYVGDGALSETCVACGWRYDLDGD